MDDQQRTGVTVTQYQGPTMRFETAQAYGAWLLSGAGDPDFAVDLHESWDDPGYAADGARIIDAMADAAGEPAPEPYRASVTLPAGGAHPFEWTITWPAGWTPPGYQVTACPACGQVTEPYSLTDPRLVHRDTGWTMCDPDTWKA